jgi:hypothetical protein
MILAADYSQLELRVLAHLSKDRRLLQVSLCDWLPGSLVESLVPMGSVGTAMYQGTGSRVVKVGVRVL